MREYPASEVVLLWHDTKEEHPDTYRFLREMGAKLAHLHGVSVVERSDGRSVTEVFRDEGFLGNNQNAMCSRILKVEQGDKFLRELRADGVDEIVKVLGFSAREADRVQRAYARAEAHGYKVRFPIVETRTTKQQCADWCTCDMGVQPSAMYEWSDHANCIGCVKGGKAYWLAVAEHHPDVYAQRSALEDEFGHGILRGGGREHHLLKDLIRHPLKRAVPQREAISIGPCECGD